MDWSRLGLQKQIMKAKQHYSVSDFQGSPESIPRRRRPRTNPLVSVTNTHISRHMIRQPSDSMTLPQTFHTFLSSKIILYVLNYQFSYLLPLFCFLIDDIERDGGGKIWLQGWKISGRRHWTTRDLGRRRYRDVSTVAEFQFGCYCYKWYLRVCCTFNILFVFQYEF